MASPTWPAAAPEVICTANCCVAKASRKAVFTTTPGPACGAGKCASPYGNWMAWAGTAAYSRLKIGTASRALTPATPVLPAAPRHNRYSIAKADLPATDCARHCADLLEDHALRPVHLDE